LDAAIRGPCWPVGDTSPLGALEIGTGFDSYRVMPDVLPLVYGPQGGFHIEARARIRGLVPGDAANISNPANPRTRYRAFFASGPSNGEPINPTMCPNRFGYVAASDGDGLTSAQPVEIRFLDNADPEQRLFGTKFKVVVEIIDADGHYAMAEQVITAVAPEGWQSPPAAN
jgi:hypothetical protein